MLNLIGKCDVGLRRTKERNPSKAVVCGFLRVSLGQDLPVVLQGLAGWKELQGM